MVIMSKRQPGCVNLNDKLYGEIGRERIGGCVITFLKNRMRYVLLNLI